jgi:hypothetical protein
VLRVLEALVVRQVQVVLEEIGQEDWRVHLE